MAIEAESTVGFLGTIASVVLQTAHTKMGGYEDTVSLCQWFHSALRVDAGIPS
jgi:hypothetical protein